MKTSRLAILSRVSARMMDLFGNVDNAKKKHRRQVSDWEAIQSDWSAVYKDLFAVTNRYER